MTVYLTVYDVFVSLHQVFPTWSWQCSKPQCSSRFWAFSRKMAKEKRRLKNRLLWSGWQDLKMTRNRTSQHIIISFRVWSQREKYMKPSCISWKAPESDHRSDRIYSFLKKNVSDYPVCFMVLFCPKMISSSLLTDFSATAFTLWL